jgi:quercetin dioxygenase-like cupin family protein
MDMIVPIAGRQLTLPKGPIFNLQRADQSDHIIGEFRSWAGYKNFGADSATNGLVHFQHVLSFSGSETTGRTGIHGHFAHAHIVIPTSGRAVFSYDGVITKAEPGSVIVQHGGTIHDQFEYTYAAASDADNRKTSLTIEPIPTDAQNSSFGFLEFFVPLNFANVEIIPAKNVSEAEQRTAWDHPYHATGANFSIQHANSPDATYRPIVGRNDLEARDARTWEPTGGLVATWIVRPTSEARPKSPAVSLGIRGEKGGIDVLHVVNGSAEFVIDGGQKIVLKAGDTLTHSHGIVGDPVDYSSEMRLIRFSVAAKATLLRERTPEEIRQLENLGPRIITHREVRPVGDTRPINFLREDRITPLRFAVGTAGAKQHC